MDYPVPAMGVHQWDKHPAVLSQTNNLKEEGIDWGPSPAPWAWELVWTDGVDPPVQLNQLVPSNNQFLHISQMISEASREGLTEAALNRYNTHSPAHTNSASNFQSNTPAVTTTAPTATSTATSFFASSKSGTEVELSIQKEETEDNCSSGPSYIIFSII
ncbi:unnamed protein product [Menidia menidia]|uniref:(Atlantic silverside) hypothetical protein n=1 Tax=Menidia menidia TaxID=238744 RepID=A0A8S4AEI2_9TELE|nr:unnamed protein product [Menidia menidia]